MVDIEFDVYSDTPAGKDPDSFSPTLRKYHQQLWSKNLPCGQMFALDLDTPRLLHHKSNLGEFFLSSDVIGNTYSEAKKMVHIVEQIPSHELRTFFSLCSTIGAFVVFPARRIDGKMTINGARGTNQKIQDRFDLTLECIRRFYASEQSPLSQTFERYSSFFDLFQNFRGYVEFFLLDDLVCDDYQMVKFWHQFSSFDASPLPQSICEYYAFKGNVEKFVRDRNRRIVRYTQNGAVI